MGPKISKNTLLTQTNNLGPLGKTKNLKTFAIRDCIEYDLSVCGKLRKRRRAMGGSTLAVCGRWRERGSLPRPQRKSIWRALYLRIFLCVTSAAADTATRRHGPLTRLSRHTRLQRRSLRPSKTPWPIAVGRSFRRRSFAKSHNHNPCLACGPVHPRWPHSECRCNGEEWRARGKANNRRNSGIPSDPRNI